MSRQTLVPGYRSQLAQGVTTGCSSVTQAQRACFSMHRVMEVGKICTAILKGESSFQKITSAASPSPACVCILPPAEAGCQQPCCELRRHRSLTAELLRPLGQAGEGLLPSASLTLCHDAQPTPLRKMRSVPQHRNILCSF